MSGVIPLALGAVLIYYVMPQQLGVDTVSAYKLMAPGATAVILYYVAMPLGWVVICVGTIALQLVMADGTGRGRREQPESAWRILRSSLIAFGITAIVAFFPFAGMDISLGHVRENGLRTHVGREAWSLVITGCVALLGAGGLFLLSRVLTRRERISR